MHWSLQRIENLKKKQLKSWKRNDRPETIYKNGKNEQVPEKNVASTTKT